MLVPRESGSFLLCRVNINMIASAKGEKSDESPVYESELMLYEFLSIRALVLFSLQVEQ